MELKEGERLTGSVIEHDGVKWSRLRTDIQRFVWRTEDGRCEVGQRTGRPTYYAKVDGTVLLHEGGWVHQVRRFKSLRLAMEGALLNLPAVPVAS